MATYSYTGSIVKVTVGSSGQLQAGTYDIVASGARGGNGQGQSRNPGGNGTEYGAFFNLTQGEKLEIVVGGIGGAGNAGGGGGGSQVLANVNGSYVPLLVAGGGGGGGLYEGGYGSGTSPGGYGNVFYQGTGAGGAGGGQNGGGGGAGAMGNGGNAAGGGFGGMSVANGAGGGSSSSGGAGGFGGGGSGGKAGGGGGGFTGGGGGTYAVMQIALGYYNVNSTTVTVGHGGGAGTTYYAAAYGTVDLAHSFSNANAGPGSIVFTAVCFASGTLIATARGDVAVEALRVGDLVVTASGVRHPIRGLGHRKTDCRRHPEATRPVRIAAHAFGPNRPARDLLVSPGHAICVDVAGEVLIPAGLLVNGSTIAQVAVEEVTIGTSSWTPTTSCSLRTCRPKATSSWATVPSSPRA